MTECIVYPLFSCPLYISNVNVELDTQLTLEKLQNESFKNKNDGLGKLSTDNNILLNQKYNRVGLLGDLSFLSVFSISHVFFFHRICYDGHHEKFHNDLTVRSLMLGSVSLSHLLEHHQDQIILIS